MSCGAGDKHIVSGFPGRIKNAGGVGLEIVAHSRDIGDINRHAHEAYTAAGQEIVDGTRVVGRLWRKRQKWAGACSNLAAVRGQVWRLDSTTRHESEPLIGLNGSVEVL